jgi:hypothetical protein
MWRGFGLLAVLTFATTSFAEEAPSFVNDVLPVLTRLGCNQGACHGKGVGQNGFRLSLRGFAPELDHQWLTREFANRRVNLTRPEESLLLTKPSGQSPHGGGILCKTDSQAYKVLLSWIAAGAPGPVPEERRITLLEAVSPATTLTIGARHPLRVEASYSDGSKRDVTWLTQFASNDAGVVDVNSAGTIEARRCGETTVRAHYQGQVAVINLSIPFERPEPSLPAPANYIDEKVFAKLKTLRIPSSSPATDEMFLRRVYLDVIGTLPTPQEVEAFVADSAPDKRARTIDALLNRPEYVDHWTLWLADLLQNRKERDHDVRTTKGVRAFHLWLRDRVARNVAWDHLTREVLTACGSTTEKPAVGYYVVSVGEYRPAEKSDVVASVAQAFLGTRIGCAKCHNHPLEKYTQDDYYHFAAYFSRVAFDRQRPEQGETVLLQATEHQQNQMRHVANLRKQRDELAGKPKPEKPEDAAEFDRNLADLDKQIEGVSAEIEKIRMSSVMTHQPRTGQQLIPQPLDRSATPIEPGHDPREALVGWITGPGRDAFAGSMVNRLWQHFLGVGLVEPVDDLRASNPPSNPELWKALCDDFIAHGYDLKHVMRTILNSQTYQLSSVSSPENETDVRFYSHHIAQRIPAEQLLDAISQVTGAPDEFAGYPAGMRTQQLADPMLESYFLSLFGRSERTTACACERQGDVTMPQLLHLLNGDTIQQKISLSEGRLATLLKDSSDDQVVLKALFLATVGRGPTADERSTFDRLRSGEDSREEVFRDLLWALLNSKEFAFNH